MSEREARILGAGELFTVRIEGPDGKMVEREYTLRPIRARHLCDVERAALRFHKQEYLDTFADNRHLLGENPQAVIDQEVAKVANWDLGNLPQKEAHSMSNVPVGEWEKETEEPNFIVNQKLVDWIRLNYGESTQTERGTKAILTHALDNGKISRQEVQEITGELPQVQRVRYDQWWVTASTEGQVTFVTSSINSGNNGQSVPREEVRNWPIAKVIEASKLVEEITMAQVENT